ncbi:MAG TPA: glycosyltransferase [Chloroflexota bacterium]|nr:glycosyltransferase [Chloroflexota bacterium]
MGVSRYLGRLALAIHATSSRQAERNYRALPTLGDEEIIDAGLVSIIIPARDEAERLPALLHSLQSLTYPEAEIIVVDDGSRDTTAEIAAAAGARVIPAGPLPRGWTGKCHACWVGAREARGEWLLFTDADTIHGPRSLSRALGRPGLTSLLARQICRTFWECLLLPYAYALYFAGASGINRPGGPDVANGQYMLFPRPVYEAVGGHAAVHASLVEDVALARRTREARFPVTLLRAEQDLAVRMYPDLHSLWDGLSKNVFRFVLHAPRSGLRTVLAGLAGGALPMMTARGPVRGALLIAPVLGLVPWLDRFGVPRRYALLQPLASVTFQILAVDGMRRTLLHTARWKGRTY